ncbi:MAG: ATP-binding protein [Bdellovibrionales bacterium]|nr:ATP-binding protein [Bdellovibrionales bacterium]
MTLKPWRELITPHKDVLDGTFKQSEFAADLTQVQSGAAPSEYKDAENFFQRTYITEGMRLLLDSVARRISGKGGDPVIQLQTSFGGGKTHALLAVFHLARREVSPEKMSGIPPILDTAGITDLPKARVAVIDGNNMSPSKPRKRGSISVNTIWGEIAWQLLGEPGYKIIAEADKEGTSPGKELLVELLKNAAPCVVLIDELVAFIRQLESGKSYVGGTFESNLSFIQALTEAMKSVPNALLLASLPESEIEVAGPMGKLALDSLEKYFARVESVWKPVATQEAFEIVKRRLFEGAGNRSEIEKVCKTFFNFYIENNTKFPSETQASQYFDRLIQSYPIHPEVFDRLYADWSTLEKFQRTRGVLQYLAIVIHRLWNSDDRDPMVMPGSLPLEDVNVRTKSIHYLPQGWEPVIETEIDGPRSIPAEIDGKETRMGAIRAARRLARTLFLGSAPSTNAQGARGLALDHIILGAAIPGQVIGVYEDALKRLRDQLQYLFGDNNRYWFDTRANLRKEMESRKLRLDGREHIVPCIREFVSEELRGHSVFSGIHVFTESADIPDEIGSGPRLVVLPPDFSSAYSRANAASAQDAANKILEKRGDQPRQRRNRLVFLASDYDSLSRLKENVKTYLAWESINKDIKDEKLNLDTHNRRQAKDAFEQSERVLLQSIRDSFKWILNPYEEPTSGRFNLKWEAAQVSTGGSNFIGAIENKMREEEWIITEWSPIHLTNILKQWYFKDGQADVVTKKVLNDFASYLYLPRLTSESVLKNAIAEGVIAEDFFGFAQGKSGDRYLGLKIGSPTSVFIDDTSLLIEKSVALKQREQERSESAASPVEPGTNPSPSTGSGFTGSAASSNPSATHGTGSVNCFTASKELNSRNAKLHFNDIIEKVLRQLTERVSTSVSISISIEATDEHEFGQEVQRTILSACEELQFSRSEFYRNSDASGGGRQ